MKTQTEHYFGGCPNCGDCSGIANVGRDHFGCCVQHRVRWWIGSNLFSSWRDQTEDEQRAIYNSIGLGHFRDVEPMPWREPLRDRIRRNWRTMLYRMSERHRHSNKWPGDVEPMPF